MRAITALNKGACLDRDVEVREDVGVPECGSNGWQVLQDERRVSHANAQPHAAIRRQLHDQSLQQCRQICKTVISTFASKVRVRKQCWQICKIAIKV
jgi:hypothetical protein